MAKPTVGAWTQLKKIGRYFRKHPRMVRKFPWQEMPDTLCMTVDADHAGCVKTRKSTSGGVMRWGRHTLKTWSSTQAVVATSSGEAEYYAIVKGASQSLGVRSILRELGRRA